MKKNVFLFLFISFQTISFSQKLVFTGSLYGYPIREVKQNDNKLYYSFNKEPFDSTQFITYSNEYNYKYEISLRKIKKEKINEVSFSKNVSLDLTKYSFCIQTFNLQEIKTNVIIKKPKTIIHSDMYIQGFNCEESFYYDAKADGNEWLVGQYKLEGASSSQTITLDNIVYVFSSKYDSLDSNYMNSEYGSWNYNKKEETLTIFSWVKRNTDLGLILEEKKKYTFRVLKEGDNITFVSDKYSLVKIN